MILENFFDKIYCINLDSRPDRWGHALKEFKKIGLKNIVRFSAIQNAKGELGCRDSHISIVKKSKEENLNRILIFEDDFEFINFEMDKLELSLKTLENFDWNLFYLGGSLDPNSKLELINSSLFRTFFVNTTHSYAVNSNVYDFIISEAPKHQIIDVFYRKLIVSKGKSFISNPMFTLQTNSFSDIAKTNVNYKWMIENFEKAKLLNNIEV